MKKIAFTLTAMTILTAAFASQALANPTVIHTNHGTHYTSGVTRVSSNYHQTYGTRFAHGYYYTGRSHSHWSVQRYDSRYGCTCYFDPCCSAWYYWCQPANCYYQIGRA